MCFIDDHELRALFDEYVATDIGLDEVDADDLEGVVAVDAFVALNLADTPLSLGQFGGRDALLIAGTGAPALGVWATIIIPASDAPAASRAVAQGEHPPHLPGPRLTGTGHSLSGVASYYWQGQMTAAGERFNKRDMTAAHKTLPFGTRVRVTRVDTGSSVIVRINDRGPFKPGRVIDLSERAAEEIGMTGAGLSPVRLEVLGR